MTKTFEIKMVEKVTYKLIDENISVVQKTVLLETSRIQRKVLEHQEKEVTHWPLLICKKLACPIALMVFCNDSLAICILCLF